MQPDGIEIQNWKGAEKPDEERLRAIMAAEELDPYRWSNGPGDVYGAHSHSYHKVIYVLEGTITFGLPESNHRIHLTAGDRLELPAGVVHDAVVGPEGVVCLEAHRR